MLEIGLEQEARFPDLKVRLFGLWIQRRINQLRIRGFTDESLREFASEIREKIQSSPPAQRGAMEGYVHH
jgi:hypothetical protein